MTPRYILIAVTALALFGGAIALSFMTQSRPFAVVVKSKSLDERDMQFMKTMRYSQPAIGGKMRFTAHCGDCHGRFGEGTDKGPQLLTQAYSLSHKDRELFHTELARAIPQHRAFLNGNGQGDLDFNGVEMMSKFLRELRKIGPPPPVEG